MVALPVDIQQLGGNDMAMSVESPTGGGMATCWFIVIESRGAWWVDCEGHAYGPLENKDEAIRYARKIAEIYGDPKRQALVWVPRNGEKPELIWSGPGPGRSGEQKASGVGISA